jgi:hypothetical protein
VTHRNEVSGRVFLGGLLSSSARLRFLCRTHPKLETIRSPVFFSERQLFPSTSVSSRLAIQQGKCSPADVLVLVWRELIPLAN